MAETYLITGASGLLGSNLALGLSRNKPVFGVVNQHWMETKQFQVLEGNLLLDHEIDRILDISQPDILINCAGMTKIDQCAKDPQKASQLNELLPARLAKATKKRKIKFVHISTATVFDGESGGYTEQDVPNPLSVYAKSKLAGEEKVFNINSEALVTRVSIFGWSPSGKRSLAEFFFNHLQQGNPVKGFTDVFFSPLLVNNMPALFSALVEGNHRGLFHMVSSDRLSKYEFGCKIAEKFGFNPDLIQPCSVDDVVFEGERSRLINLNNRKLLKTLEIPPSKLSTDINAFYALYQQGFPHAIQSLLPDEDFDK